MSAVIFRVSKDGLADRYGITSGCVIDKINGTEVFDILEYRFLISEKSVKIEYTTPEGEKKRVRIKNNFEDLGIEFENPLIDSARSCRNNCIFCFIDQLPKGMRETLYFKDDDSRLSFLHGNYVTLTNMSMEDIKRLAKIRVSPINISVQTTNPALRCRMLNNRFAGDLLDKMKYLAKHHITMNCQIVLCPGINDGDELVKSLLDLSKLHPSVASVSVVPVGITKFRDGLYPMAKYDNDGCRAVLDIVNTMQERFIKKLGTRFIYAADEFYLGANVSMPDFDEYEGFPQIENGVGMSVSLKHDFLSALKTADDKALTRTISMVTGTAVFPLMRELADCCERKFGGVKINVYPVENEFFGKTITVSGLLTAGDIINQIKDKELGEFLLITKNMLKADEDIFLDDVTLEEFSQALGVKVKCVSDDGYELLDMIMEN